MISEQVGMRELVTLDGNGVLLRGTYHKTGGEGIDSTRKVGVLFLNALFHPRAANGDSAVYWADSFAERGYPSFRFDLPGLGDSYGVIPNDLLRFINEGGYTSITTVKVKELVQTFGLSGAVMFGHCAGATTAIYAAAECKECKGLVLMDPYFNFPKALTSKLNPKLVFWARRSKLGAVIRAIYDLIREGRRGLRKTGLPANANFAFISRWKKVVSSGIPILILKSPEPAALGSDKLRAVNFDYLGHILSFATRNDQITIKTIEETNHSFANRAGRVAVEQETEAWLSETFPEAHPETRLADTPSLQVGDLALTLGNSLAVHASVGE